MKKSRTVFQLTVLAILIAFTQAFAEAPNLLINGDFERGNKGWKLTDDKNNPGGEIIKESGGNQVLHGPKGRSFLASLSGEGLDAEGIKKLAGSKVTLSFRVKGDQYAHPLISLNLKAGGKQNTVSLMWKSNYPSQNISVKPVWSVVTRDAMLPANIEEIHSLDIHNGGEEIFYDDIKLAAWSAETVKAVEPDPAWLGMTFASGEEIMEFANTCNFLLCEWSRALSDVYGLRRAAHYLADAAQEKRALALEKTVWKYRDELTSLRDLYIKVLTERYGKLFTSENPWGFYAKNDYAGKKMMSSVMNRKSAKEPLVDFEKKLQGIQDDVTSLQKKLFNQACKQLGWTPAPIAPYARPEKMFDDKGNPTHIIFGARNKGHYSLFATQWLYPEITGHVDFKLDMKTGQFTNMAWYADALKPFKAKGWARPTVIPLNPWPDPDFLARANAEPQEYYESTEDGVIGPSETRGGRGHQFQFLNPKVMTALEEQYAAYSKLCKQNEDMVACLFLVSEHCFYNVAQKKPVGYSPRFKKGFQDMLAAKFGNIAKLNRAWESDYKSFADIALPTKALFDAMPEKDLPLIYEYRKYRKDCYSTFFEKVYAACKKGSDFPVATSSARDYMNGNSLDPWDSLRQAKATDVDTHHHCMEGGSRQDALNVYHNSMERYAGGKKSGSDEYYPTNPLGLHWSWQSDPFILFSLTAQNIWKDLASDYALLYIWWTYQHGDRAKTYSQGSYERRSGITLLEEYNGTLPYLQKRLADGVHDAFFKTRKALPETAVLAPFDATMVCWPDARIMHEGWLTHNFLADNYREYEYVPEQLVTSGEENLAGFKALLAPYTLWAQDKVQEKLLKWVEAGGTLIAIGPYGYWNEYGRKSGKLIEECFGKLPLQPKRGEACWTFRLAESDLAALPAVKVESARAGECRLVSAKYGKGMVYLTLDTTLDTLPVEAKRIINGAIMEAAGLPMAYCANRNFFLYIRENPETQERYLIAVNKDIKERTEDTITVLGEYPRPVDMACPGGFPAPAETGAGYTTLRLSLAPGEGTVLYLGKYDGKRVDRKAMSELVEGQSREEREKVLRVLDGLESGGEISYARAMACRNAALEMMKADQFGPAFAWSQKAAEYARQADAPDSGEAFKCAYSRTAPAIDGDDKDWGDADWNELGASRFKTKWDERNLYFLAELKDDEIINTASAPSLWSGDGMEMYLNVLNMEGHREMGQLDYQYCFASSGKAQVMRLAQTKISSAQVAVKPIDKGYRLEIAVPHGETMLAPVDGYELAFNLRHSDYGMKTNPAGQKRLEVVNDTRLKNTGTALHADTFGWPKLRLTGGRKSLRPGVNYSKAKNTITVNGLGCTLERMAREVNDQAVMSIDKEGALINADIAVADFSDLALTMNVRSRAKGTGALIKAGAGARIELRGNYDLLNVDLTAEAEKGLWSLGKTEVRLMREMGLTVTDKNGRPLPKLNAALTGRDKRDNSVAFSYGSLYADEKGRATFAAPAAVITVSDDMRPRAIGLYEVIVEAKEVPGQYPTTEPVEPSKKTEYKVVFEYGYDGKR